MPVFATKRSTGIIAIVERANSSENVSPGMSSTISAIMHSVVPMAGSRPGQVTNVSPSELTLAALAGRSFGVEATVSAFGTFATSFDPLRAGHRQASNHVPLISNALANVTATRHCVGSTNYSVIRRRLVRSTARAEVAVRMFRARAARDVSRSHYSSIAHTPCASSCPLPSLRMQPLDMPVTKTPGS